MKITLLFGALVLMLSFQNCGHQADASSTAQSALDDASFSTEVTGTHANATGAKCWRSPSAAPVTSPDLRKTKPTV